MSYALNLKDDSIISKSFDSFRITQEQEQEQNQEQNKIQNIAEDIDVQVKITDFYIREFIAKGTFGIVEKAIYLSRNKIVAIKTFPIESKFLTQEEIKIKVKKEVEIMSKIDHPNIVKYYAHFLTEKNYYIIMEYLPYNLKQTIIENKAFSARKAAKIVCEIISSLYYLHNMDPPIIHRDIKRDNIAFDENGNANLIDFGEANYLKTCIKTNVNESGQNISISESNRKTFAGTKGCIAPEILNHKSQDEKVDIWSIGILLYELLTGTYFNNLLISDDIKKFKITWPPDIDIQAKEVIKKILKINPNERLSLENILKHPFFKANMGDCSQYLINPSINSKYKINPLFDKTIVNSNDSVNKPKENIIAFDNNDNTNMNTINIINKPNRLSDNIDNSFNIEQLKQQYSDNCFSKETYDKLKEEKEELEQEIQTLKSENKELIRKLNEEKKNNRNIIETYTNHLKEINQERIALKMKNDDLNSKLIQTNSSLSRSILDEDQFFNISNNNHSQFRDTEISKISMRMTSNGQNISCNCKNEFEQYKTKKEDEIELLKRNYNNQNEQLITERMKIKDLESTVKKLVEDIEVEKSKYIRYDEYEKRLADKEIEIGNLTFQIVALKCKLDK